MIYKTNIPVSSLVSSNQNNNLVENKFGFQDKLYSCNQKRDKQLISLSSKILQTSINQKQGMHPRRFCRRWFGLEATKKNGKSRFTEGQILAMESEHGYREQCINLIASLLKIKPNTIHRWGKGVAFDKIPTDKREKYEIYLSYIDAIRVITTTLVKLDEVSLSRLLRQLEMR
ncbi:hypothetical protein [Pleurocapsa sp. PCC 7319]|uniref:hypothetical protein n=1 Tax=Pleurocapsa sp. PCC 7319 TaxID=118161 RepID=UPI0003499CC5|nr:hypothetical protein [Pleurocapsa sp. PCC 7319]